MRPQKVTDQELREHQAQGTSGVEIARLHGITESGVSHRLRKLDQAPVPMNPAILDIVSASVWDIQKGLEENYARCKALLDAPFVDQVRLLAEMRAHMKMAFDVTKTMYDIQEVQTFQDEVLNVLDECEPGLRNKILTALSRRRALRAAFIQRPDAVPDI